MDVGLESVTSQTSRMCLGSWRSGEELTFSLKKLFLIGRNKVERMWKTKFQFFRFIVLPGCVFIALGYNSSNSYIIILLIPFFRVQLSFIWILCFWRHAFPFWHNKIQCWNETW